MSGIKNISVTQCYFESTDRGLRIKTRRGRGKDSIIDGILFENIYMNNVLALTVNMFIFVIGMERQNMFGQRTTKRWAYPVYWSL